MAEAIEDHIVNEATAMKNPLEDDSRWTVRGNPSRLCGDDAGIRSDILKYGKVNVVCTDPTHRHGEPPEPWELTDQEKWDWFDHGIIPERHRAL